MQDLDPDELDRNFAGLPPHDAYAKKIKLDGIRRQAQACGGLFWIGVIAAGICYWLWHWIPALICVALALIALAQSFFWSVQSSRFRRGLFTEDQIQELTELSQELRDRTETVVDRLEQLPKEEQVREMKELNMWQFRMVEEVAEEREKQGARE